MRRDMKIQLENLEVKVEVMSQKTGRFSKRKIGKNILKKQRISPRGPTSNQNRKKTKNRNGMEEISTLKCPQIDLQIERLVSTWTGSPSARDNCTFETLEL